MSAPNKNQRVVIVGAGPVGMVCALALNKRGVSVTVFEQEPAPVEDQRAASLHPSTLALLHELGVTEKIIPLGLVSPTYRFHDRVNNEVVAEFDLGRMRDEFMFPFVLQYEQYKLTASIFAEYANADDFDVRFSQCVTGMTQTADGVEIEYTSPDGEGRLPASYVIGCDGGRSTIRKLAGIEFEGFTYPERFIKIATSFDFGTVNSNLAFRNYFSDPDEWCNLFKVCGKRPPGLWRAIFPVPNDEDDAVALSPERIEARLQKFFPKSGRYHVEYVNVYPVSQRVAATFRKGRVLLAGDAAHVNNPIGGMGMNGGIHDAMNLTAKLADVWFGRAGPEVFDRYTRQRRKAQVDYVQAQTIQNKRSLEEKDPVIRRKHLDELRRISEDVKLHKQFLYRAALIDSLNSANAVE